MNTTYNSTTNLIQQKQKLSGTKTGGSAATFRHQFKLAEALMKEMVASNMILFATVLKFSSPNKRKAHKRNYISNIDSIDI